MHRQDIISVHIFLLKLFPSFVQLNTWQNKNGISPDNFLLCSCLACQIIMARVSNYVSNSLAVVEVLCINRGPSQARAEALWRSAGPRAGSGVLGKGAACSPSPPARESGGAL